jgi:hypothetical protein
MMNVKAYAKTILDLRESLLRAAGLASLEFPGELDPESEFVFMGPTTLDNYKLKSLAEEIHQSIATFDRLQRAIGLPTDDDGWFTRYLHSQCRDCGRPLNPSSKP